MTEHRTLYDFKCKIEEKETAFIWHYTTTAENIEQAEIKAKAIISSVARVPFENLRTVSIINLSKRDCKDLEICEQTAYCKFRGVNMDLMTYPDTCSKCMMYRESEDTQ